MGLLQRFFDHSAPPSHDPTHDAPPEDQRFERVSHYGSLIRLRKEFEERYIILHRHTFPGVLDRIRRSNIRNYSIFLHEGILFSHFDYVGMDFVADQAAMADEVTREWWKLTDSMQQPFPWRKKGEWWASLQLVGHLGGDVSPAKGLTRHAVQIPTGSLRVEGLRKFLTEHRAAIGPLLRKFHLQNGCCYSGGGNLYAYLEHVGSDWQADVASLVADPEFKKARKELQSLSSPGREVAHRASWMREVFHLD